MNSLFKIFLLGIGLGTLYSVSYAGFSAAFATQAIVDDGPSIEKLTDWYAEKHPDATPWESCEQEVE